MVVAALFSAILTMAILWVSLWWNLSYAPRKEKEYVELYRKILYLQNYNSINDVDTVEVWQKFNGVSPKEVVKTFMRELRILVKRGCIKTSDVEELTNWMKGMPGKNDRVLKIFEKIKMQKEVIED